ncbi:MAG TPA: hypothetical protein PKU97_13510, partial [Kofleriaceae bacterium]|nr:hypothetical protein [Kofleriaceae bacterium]
MTIDASSNDRTTKAFERLDIPLPPRSEPTVVVTEPTVALPRRDAAMDPAGGEATVVVTESTLAALAAQTAPLNEADPGAKTVPFEPVTGVAL